MDTVIQIEHLQKHFGDLQVLNDVDFRIERGKVVTIIGSSGSGKRKRYFKWGLRCNEIS